MDAIIARRGRLRNGFFGRAGERRELKGRASESLRLKPADGKPVETGWGGNWLEMGMCELDHR
jgi:hypothetical protein